MGGTSRFPAILASRRATSNLWLPNFWPLRLMALCVLRWPPAMLVLARKQNQNIIIDGNIVVRVLRVGRDVVKIGIEAPLSIPVHREEIFNALKEGQLKTPSAERKS